MREKLYEAKLQQSSLSIARSTLAIHCRSQISALLGLVMLGAAQGCRNLPGKFATVEDGRTIVVDYNGSSLPGVGQETATIPLRYDVVYFAAPLPGVNRAQLFMRFWPNGRMMSGFIDSGKPIPEQVDTLPNWAGGRFYVSGDRFYCQEVGYEEDQFFGRWYPIWGLMKRGKVHPDGSIEVEFRPYQSPFRWIQEGTHVYKPKSIGPLTKQADW